MRHLVAFVLAVSSCAPAVGQEPKAEKPKPARVVDKDWEPKPGDKAELYDPKGNVIFVAVDMFAYEAYMKSLKAKDVQGMMELGNKRRLGEIPSGTPVLVIERHNNRFIGGG